MQLERIKIHSMPGIEDGFELTELLPGMNIISGPNGIGKTSMCRAIRALLWNEGDAEIQAEATWRLNDVRLAVSRSRGEVRWQTGNAAPPPTLPAPQLAGCYTLRVDELLAAEARDTELATAIQREMAGGYDVRALRLNNQFKGPGPATHRTDYQRVQKTVEDCKRAQEELKDRELRLPELIAQRDAASQAPRSLRQLGDAERLTEARLRLVEIRHARAQFPRRMGRFTSDDRKELTRLKQQLQRCREEMDAAAAGQAQAAAEIAACRIPGAQPIAPAVIDEYRMRVADLLRREQECVTADGELQQQTAVVAAALCALAPYAPPTTARVVSSSALQRAEEYLRQHLEASATVAASTRTLDYLAAPDGLPDPDTLVRGITSLTRWLSVTGEAPKLVFPVGRSILLALFGLVAFGGVVGGLLVHPSDWLLVPLGVAGLITVSTSLRFRSGAASEAEQHRHYFQQLALEAPAQWGRSDVERILGQLLQQQGEARAADQLKQRQQLVTADITQQQQRQITIEQNWQQFEADSGLDLGIPNLPSVTLLRRIGAYEAALREQERAAVMARSRQDAYADVLNRCNQWLEENGAAVGADHTSVQSRFADLVDRDRRLQVALDRHSKATEGESRFRPELEEHRRALHRFFLDREITSPLPTSIGAGEAGEAGWAGADEALSIEARLPRLEADFNAAFARLDDWRRLESDRRDALRTAREQRLQLADAAELQRLTREEIAERRAAALGYEASLEVLSNEIAAIEHELKVARTAVPLAEARAAREQLQEQIGERRGRLLYASAAQLLLDEVEQEHTASRSGVLARASNLFSEFTHHEYSLEVDSGGDRVAPAYCAMHTATARRKTLAELSGGTRVQLLLAARLAFAEAEEGAKLPLFLDETLKHSDPHRAEQMLTCLGQLIRAGRQLFYLTNDPTDVTRIRAVLAPLDVEVGETDLAAVRGERAEWSAGRKFAPAPLAEVPSPAGCTPDEYRVRLATPPFDPRQPHSAVPLFYPLRDRPELLHRLLQIRHQTVGQWQALRTSSHRALDITAGEREWIRDRIAVLAAFQEAWVLAEGKELTASALRNPDAQLSKRYQDGLGDLAKDCNGNAKRVLAILDARSDPRVQGFRKDAREPLVRYLEENGYLGSGECTEAALLAYTLPLAGASSLSAGEITAFVHLLWEYATAATGQLQ